VVVSGSTAVNTSSSTIRGAGAAPSAVTTSTAGGLRKGQRLIACRPDDPRERLVDATCERLVDGGNSVVVIAEGATAAGAITVPARHAAPWTGPPDATTVVDLLQIRNAQPLPLLFALQQRYYTGQPYTWMSQSSLVYLNPFQRSYAPSAAGAPHPYSVGRAAVAALRSAAADPTPARAGNGAAPSGKSVAVVVTGQSGAGKTEATKMVMAEFTRALPSAPPRLEEVLEAANPLIESFGNCVTAANRNSSRFVRFVSWALAPTAAMAPLSVRVECHLLELSRVCGVREGESNFHMFYALIDGASLEDRVRLDIADIALFRSLAPTAPAAGSEGWLTCAPPHSLTKIDAAFDAIGVTANQRGHIYGILAGVLHLCNVSFTAPDPHAPARVADDVPLVAAAKCLHVPAATLTRLLTTAQITPQGSATPVIRNYSMSAAMACRDTLARSLYKATFDFVIGAVNAALAAVVAAAPSTSAADIIGAAAHVSFEEGAAAEAAARPPLRFCTLDVFGFESVRNVPGAPGVAAPGNPASAVNGLEQLLINVANEELQNLFTETAVVDFCEELVREGVDASAAALSGAGGSDAGNNAVSGGSPGAAALSVAPRTLMGDEINNLIHMQRTTLTALRGKGGVLANITDDSMLGAMQSSPAALCDRVSALASKYPASILRPSKGSGSVADPEMAARNRSVGGGVTHSLMFEVSDPHLKSLLQDAMRYGSGSGLSGSGATTGSSAIRVTTAAAPSVNVAGPPGAAASHPLTVVLQEQLKTLLSTLRGADISWIRCIKPNDAAAPDLFAVPSVRRQLACCGVFAAASLLSRGFSVRMPHRDFAQRYAVAADPYPKVELQRCDHKRVCAAILKSALGGGTTRQHQSAAGPSGTAVTGLTKVFLDAAAMTAVADLAARKLAVLGRRVQRAGRGLLERRAVAAARVERNRRLAAEERQRRIELERPLRALLEAQRAEAEDAVVARLEAAAAAAANAAREISSALTQRLPTVIERVQAEVRRACEDVANAERGRLAREEAERQKQRLALEIQKRQATAAARQARATSLVTFRRDDADAARKRNEAKAAAAAAGEYDRLSRLVGAAATEAQAAEERRLSREWAQRERRAAESGHTWVRRHLDRTQHRWDAREATQQSALRVQHAGRGYLLETAERMLRRDLAADARSGAAFVPPEAADLSQMSLGDLSQQRYVSLGRAREY
jgi:hypothetical protein